MQRKDDTAERSWPHPLRKPFHAGNSNDKQDKKGGSENLKEQPVHLRNNKQPQEEEYKAKRTVEKLAQQQQLDNDFYPQNNKEIQ